MALRSGGMLCLSTPRNPSGSMHQSCLRPEEKITTPRINMAPLEEALKRDAAAQRWKYRQDQPSASTARYNTGLPGAPQHQKLCRAEVRRPPPDKVVQKFDERTLNKWFNAIDLDGNGKVSQKELIVALQRNPGLRDLFMHLQGVNLEALGLPSARQEVSGAEEAGNERKNWLKMESTDYQASVQDTNGWVRAIETPPEPASGSPRERTMREKMLERKQELRRFRQILHDVDTDGSGEMDWEEFVEFFRRAGMLLEYRADQIDCGGDFFQSILQESLSDAHSDVDVESSVLARDVDGVFFGADEP